jgi:hypothetical protein
MYVYIFQESLFWYFPTSPAGFEYNMHAHTMQREPTQIQMPVLLSGPPMPSEKLKQPSRVDHEMRIKKQAHVQSCVAAFELHL